MRTRIGVGALVVLLACHADTIVPADGGQGGLGLGGAGGSSGGQGGTGEFTDCTSPNGFRICNGVDDCPNQAPECDKCLGDIFTEATGELSICANEAWFDSDGGPCWKCQDGSICGEFVETGVVTCGPFELGVLFEHGGGADRLRYADHSAWTGEELPVPTTCPDLEGAAICGPYCGGCAAGQICTGRSPRHPYGVCVDHVGEQCMREHPEWCPPGEGCFLFTVEPEMQPIADEHGHCFAVGRCLDTASQLPGGAECLLP